MKNAYRIIDVNLNRLFEGLKTVEDIVRFQLEDDSVLRQIRRVHFLTQQAARAIPYASLIAHRMSEQDLGRESRFDGQPRLDVADLLRANFNRIKAAARVLEEVAKVQKLPFARFKELRFKIYDIEKHVVRSMMKRFDPRFYVILDEKYSPELKLGPLVKGMAEAGVGLVQLRMKQSSAADFYRLAKTLRQLTAGTGTKLIINDRLDIALAVEADGLHIGQTDLPLVKVKEIAGHFIVGQSVDNVSEARRAEREGADYVAVGSIFPTPTKHDAKVVGLKILKNVAGAVEVPVVAIGGITLTNARQVFRHGASGIAVCSAVLEGNADENLRRLGKLLRRIKGR